MLTNHPEGSVRQLWALAFPLMISSLSSMTMLFVDRLMLSHYSLEAHNSAVCATTLGWAFVYGWIALTAITEVFVAQSYGAGEESNLGRPVWQMIWLSLGSTLFFWPLALWGGSLFFGSAPEAQMQRTYFSWMMLFAPGYPLFAALCGFFIGRGKPNLITVVALAANLCNIFLDYILIFGWGTVVPSMGIKGAAIATNAALLFEIAILGAVFLAPKARKAFGTGRWRLNKPLFWQCVRVGLPGGVFAGIEILGWAMFYLMMEKMGDHYITVAGITQSLLLLLYFFAEGLSKAVAAVVGNVIGAGRPWMIPRVMRSSYILVAIFCAILLALFLFFGEQFIVLFLSDASASDQELLRPSLLISILLGLIFTFFEGLRLALTGALTAVADTLFLLIVGSLSIWLMMVLPVYVLVVRSGHTIELAMLISVVYALLAAFLYWWRLRSGSWEKRSKLV